MQTNPSSPSAEDRCPACGHHPLGEAGKVKDHSVSGEWFGLLACPACGLRKTAPQPAPEVIGKYYASSDYVSHSDTRTGAVNQLYHFARQFMLGRKAAWVIQAAGRTSGRLLDVGAGTGYFAEHMRDRGWTVTALEPDEGARRLALERAKLAIRPAEDLFTLEPGTFDVITLWHVLEHVHAPADYLRQFRKLLAPGGMLIIAVPNPESRDARQYGPDWAAWDVPRHLWHFSPEAMRRMFLACGFAMSGMRTMPLDAFYVSMLSERYKGRGFMSLMTGAWSGLRTWIASWANRERASSLIYFGKPA
jgi:SAM-dependent methyltransferase